MWLFNVIIRLVFFYYYYCSEITLIYQTLTSDLVANVVLVLVQSNVIWRDLGTWVMPMHRHHVSA